MPCHLHDAARPGAAGFDSSRAAAISTIAPHERARVSDTSHDAATAATAHVEAVSVEAVSVEAASVEAVSVEAVSVEATSIAAASDESAAANAVPGANAADESTPAAAATPESMPASIAAPPKPAPAFPVPAPRDWFGILAELHRLGRNNAEVARLLGLNPNTVRNWKYGSEPLHSTGEALIELLRRRRRSYAVEQHALRKREARVMKETMTQADNSSTNAPHAPTH